MFSQNDYELLYYIDEGNKHAEELLLKKYHLLVWKLVNQVMYGYVPLGVEKDDLYQEGTIALFDTFKTYDKDLGVPFFSFVKLCVERRVLSYLRKYRSLSNKQFYDSLSLDAFISEEISVYNSEILEDTRVISPFIKYDEKIGKLYLHSEKLNSFEKEVLILQLAGFSYQETSELLECTSKKVDNTLQKIKRLLT